MANHRMMHRAGFFLGLFLAVIAVAAPGSFAQACNHHDHASEAKTHASAPAKQAASRMGKQDVRAVLLVKAQTEKTRAPLALAAAVKVFAAAVPLLSPPDLTYHLRLPLRSASGLAKTQGAGV
jgi:hypothetical protein